MSTTKKEKHLLSRLKENFERHGIKTRKSSEFYISIGQAAMKVGSYKRLINGSIFNVLTLLTANKIESGVWEELEINAKKILTPNDETI